MMTSIDTAVPLLEKNDLEQPLLIKTTATTTSEEEYSKWNTIHLGGGGDDDDDEEDEQKTRTSSTNASCCWGQRFLTSRQFLTGFLLGFITHTVAEIIAIIAINSGAHLAPIWGLFIAVIFIAIVFASNVDYDGGFRFHFGLLCGCFFVLGVMDFYVGALLSVSANRFATMLAWHSLCYIMGILHDRFKINE